ncbi:hypothetical protein NQ315_015846 [Exocentrus adspersus]|uniref:NADH:ubiquinone oxidoreductase intermediate-associated protein 30 domain-containing protein n=1 Tax=Exocentrus adspersus TaxID=1586481 RepID=A0AAV8W4R1_9CUCU|nr:hypothetical protein NQ315_015846 [Exocentrus adspersus]
MCIRVIAVFAIICTTLFTPSYCDFYIDDFTDESSDATQWVEHSDTRMTGGKSKASLVLLETDSFKRAVLFTLLNPLPSGAAFAGVKKDLYRDISRFSSIILRVKAQGQFRGYEVFLRETEDPDTKFPSFVHYFKAPSQFQEIRLRLKDFKRYLKGVRMPNSNPINKCRVASIGILAYGGKHMSRKQRGVGSLEIEWIKFVE